MTFTAPTGAKAVYVEQSTNGTTWTKVTTELLVATSTSATARNLKNGTHYHFRLIVTGGAYAGISNMEPIRR